MIHVHPNAVIDQTVQLADNVKIGPNCVVQAGSSIGADTVLHSNVVVGPNVTIGNSNQVFPTATIGTQPQVLGLKTDEKVGRIVIGDRNIIREQATIHPSMYHDQMTRIGSDNLLMIGVHIGHDSVLEDKIVMSNYVQVSGHCKIQTGVWLSGMVLLHQFVTIGRWSYAAGLAGINHDIPPFVIVSGHYPPRVRGINKRGLKRAGFDQQQQEQIFHAYKKLYRNNGPLLKNAEELAVEDGLDPNVKEMIETIINSNKHRFGRYLESFRH